MVEMVSGMWVGVVVEVDDKYYTDIADDDHGNDDDDDVDPDLLLAVSPQQPEPIEPLPQPLQLASQLHGVVRGSLDQADHTQHTALVLCHTRQGGSQGLLVESGRC